MNILVLTTLPHFFAVYPFYASINPNFKMGTPYTLYPYVIYLSTALSILYHWTNEKNKIVSILDHSVAFLWFGFDTYMGFGYAYPNAFPVLGLNLLIGMLNRCIPDSHYTLLHSLWHILSAAKAYRVSYLLLHSLD